MTKNSECCGSLLEEVPDLILAEWILIVWSYDATDVVMIRAVATPLFAMSEPVLQEQ